MSAVKNFIIYFFIFVLGFASVFFGLKLIFSEEGSSKAASAIKQTVSMVGIKEHQVIGFAPYWLLSKMDKDYSSYINTFTYFGLTVEGDGSIRKYVKKGEKEPGWHSLDSDKVSFPKNTRRSLLVFSGEPETINELVSDPVSHANKLMEEVVPIMEKYSFDDLNLDIENVLLATAEARINFTEFVKTVKSNLHGKTLTIDSSPTDLVKMRLIDLSSVGQYVDYVLLMTYDYHYSGSFVTGPVAPVAGAGTYSEFDTETGIQKALELLPKEKILLGVPLYGYEWESITNTPRAAVIPGSGIAASTRRVDELLANCSDECIEGREEEADEAYLIYKDKETGTYHQIFYPDAKATQAKIDLANKYDLGGIGFWALGYEGNNVLDPVSVYKDALK